MRKLSRKRKVKRKRVSKRKVMRGGETNKSTECDRTTSGYCPPDTNGRERVCVTEQSVEGEQHWYCSYKSSKQPTTRQTNQTRYFT